MAIEFLDWSGVQKLWTKIKNTFQKKGDPIVIESGGNNSFSAHLDIDGYLIMGNGDAEILLDTTKGGNIALKSDITTAIANAGHLKREKVSALPGVAMAKENVIYMVSNSTTGNNKFDEYMLIDGAWEKTGSSDIDLSGYPTTEQMNTAISNAHTAITEAQINSLS